ncbi:hypothetical protein IFM89_022294 [Coptis chinensis]|uniref:soluble epoxide hydrolase n=1 Tax=Coptis chinensis TaxID=261450 RepID=A0A835HWF8_9MAGN|nr:hypothetical protein IFM89_017476 [Coptis chinensis]KAF9606059.1 hypothetical protein IFM89_022294 [Coptis chinensis]
MEGILHRSVEVNGINMHVAEKGEGSVVLFLHGFPELWYSWRHQIIAIAAQGYRAVAPDLRGYGDTVAPTSIFSYTCFHIVGDVIALIDTLGVDQVFVVGHDWGAIIAWYLCLFRPDRVKALVNLSVAFIPRDPSTEFVEGFRSHFGDDYYVVKFQEPGVVEAEFASVSTETLVRNILTSRRTGPIMVPKGGGYWTSTSNPPPLPSWLSEEDITYNASKFEAKGFTGPLNYYRAFDLNWELTAPWTGGQVKVPTLFIVGDLDVTYTTPGWMEYIHSDSFKKDVPLLEEVIVMEDVAHFINQEKPNEINKYIYDFFQKF